MQKEKAGHNFRHHDWHRRRTIAAGTCLVVANLLKEDIRDYVKTDNYFK